MLLIAGALLAQEASEISVNATIVVGEPEGAPVAGDALERLTEEVAGLMRCPVCQGLSVADSPSESALAMKDEVRELLAAGFTPEQTIRYFETSYGEFIRLEPKPEGFNVVVWIAPAAMLALGVAVVVWRLRRARHGRVDAVDDAAPGHEDDPELAAYLEQVRREVAAARGDAS